MTPPQDPDIQRIERDRRKREDELLLLLLALAALSQHYALAAVRMGHDPIAAARDIWVGNARLGRPGIAPRAARVMADAEQAGFRRAWLLAGATPPPAATNPPATPQMVQAAQEAAAEAFAPLAERLRETSDLPILESPDVAAQGKAVREAFDAAGWTEASPYALDRLSTHLVLPIYNAGLWRGWQSPDLSVTGFRFRAILDDRTTRYCRPRDGIQLAKDNPFWRKNWPPIHWNCRSVVLPLKGAFEPRGDIINLPPPMPGFGAVGAGPGWYRT